MEVVLRECPVLYQPLNLTYPCDGILMPSVDAAGSTIIVLETSTTPPTDAGHVRKVLRFLEPGGVAYVLARRFPELRCVVALVYDGDLVRVKKPLGAQAALLAAGTAAGPTHAVRVRVLDRVSLVALGDIAL